MNIQDLIAHGGTSVPATQDQPRAFLAVMWGALPAGTVIGLSVDTQYYSQKSGKWEDSSIADWALIDEYYDFEAWAVQQNNTPALITSGHGSIFWNVAARKPIILAYPRPAYKRGKSTELAALCVFNVDLDVVEGGYDYNAAFDGILAFPLKPTAIVYTGGGFQVLWALSEAWSVETPAEVQRYKAYGTQLQRMMADHLGMTVDYKTAEAARMLRMPGFINRKLKRNGALAQLVYWSPETRYPIAAMLAFIGELPEPPHKSRATGGYKPENGVYLVGSAFVDYFIHDVQRGATQRHGALLQIASEAAKAGIPRDALTPRIGALARRWYADDPTDQGPYGELDAIIDWAYEKFNTDDFAEGLFAIQLTSASFQRVIDEPTSQVRERARVIDIAEPPAPPDTLPLAELRTVQRAWIDAMLREPLRNVARLYLLATSPGTGKTHDLLQAILTWVLEATTRGYAPHVDKGIALFLTQFKIDEAQTDEWLASQQIPPEHWHLFGFFFARDKHASSKGYCENYDKAQIVGAKGHNVVATLCAYCPFQQKCRESGYLAQFKRLEHKAIVVGRWLHGYMEELIATRKIAVFDESVIDLITSPTVIGMDELFLRYVQPTIADQYPSEVALVDCFLMRLREILRGNQSLRLGGAWLRDALLAKFGADNLAKLIRIPKKALEGMNPFDVGDLTNPTNAILNYLIKLIDIVRYEYDTHRAVKQYNSRLIAYKSHLYIFPVEPFTFTRDTRVFAADATPIPEYYRHLFGDRHVVTLEKPDGTKQTVRRPRPRQLEIFDTQLEPKAHITVFTDSENTKSTFKKGLDATEQIAVPDAATPVGKLDDKALDGINQHTYTMQDTIRLAAQVRQHNPETAHTMIMIHRLAKRFGRKLLVIMYKFLVGDAENQTFLRRWLAKSGIIPMQNVQWFYTLRGKNDWKDCRAVLLVGTPRIREEDLFMKAQVLHYDDLNPLNTERQWRELPYASRDKHGHAKAYRYYGYKDDRVDRLYVHMIASELRQDYERIRANLDDDKHVFLATPFPCSDHVDEFLRWELAVVQQCAHEVLMKAALVGWFNTPAALAAICEAANCSRNTADKVLWRVFTTGDSDIPHAIAQRNKTWQEVFPDHGNAFRKPKLVRTANVPLSTEDRLTNMLMNGIGRMLQAAGQLSPAKVRKQFIERYPDEQPTDKDLQGAIKRYKTLSKLAV